MSDEKTFADLGPGFERDPNKTDEENFKAMQAYYAKRGIKVSDMTPEEKKMYEEKAEKIEAELRKLL